MSNKRMTKARIARWADDEVLQYRLLFMATFILLLLVALVSSALGLNWRAWIPGADDGGSLLGSVRAAVGSVVPLTFV